MRLFPIAQVHYFSKPLYRCRLVEMPGVLLPHTLYASAGFPTDHPRVSVPGYTIWDRRLQRAVVTFLVTAAMRIV